MVMYANEVKRTNEVKRKEKEKNYLI